MTKAYIKPMLVQFAAGKIIFLLIFGGIGLYLLHSTQASLHREQELGNLLKHELSVAKLQVVQIQQYIQDSTTTGERSGVDAAAKALATGQEALTKLQRLSPADEKELASIRQQAAELYDMGVRMVAAYEQSREAGNKIMQAADGFDARSNAIQAVLDRLSEAVEQRMNQILTQIDRNMRFASWFLIFLVVEQCVTTIFGIRKIYRLIIKQLGAEPPVSVRLAQRLTEGDLVAQINTEHADADSLIANLGRMRSRWVDVLQGLRGQFLLMSSTTAEVSESSRQLAENCGQQHRSTQTIAANVEQLSASVDQLAEDVASASTQVERSDGTANQATQAIAAVVQEIEVAAKSVEAAAQQMTALDARANEIVGIVTTIKAIADQTNLLALNAAIEAARAGESGRGFAVVADEVRSLAQRTAESTQTIGALVADVHSSTASIRATIGESVERVHTGVQHSNEALRFTRDIHSNSESVTAEVQRINLALHEQRQNLHGIVEHLSQIAELTELNTSSAQQLSVAVTRLEQTSKATEKEIDYFKLGGGNDLTLF